MCCDGCERSGIHCCAACKSFLSGSLYFEGEGSAVDQLKSFDRQVASFKVFELQLNFETKMVRFELSPLPSSGLIGSEFQDRRKEHNKLFAILVRAEKRRQSNIEDYAEWPKSLPWVVPQDVWSMPIVIWITKAKKTSP